MRSWVIGATGKLLWIWHELYVEGRLRATEEVLGVHVDPATPAAPPFPSPTRWPPEIHYLPDPTRPPTPPESIRVG